ncbi:hypothetical protein BKA56DRAFT_594144 [Ilyonectria sp. MPI-CAGE-AT-0026]|nr:hypothetical protein BKA56DRAFT_594144 [Ilyonectria sp. MPI-CAGE-AT-0026]
MGRFISSSKSYEALPKLIVILEWESSPQTTSPHLKFWALEPPIGKQPNPAPIPVTVPNRIEDLGPRLAEKDGQRIHLPPLLAFDGTTTSIMMHNLAVGANVDVEFSRWGPGIRLCQIQAMTNLFQGAPDGLGDLKYLSPVGSMRSDDWREYEDQRGGSSLLTAIAMDNGDGTVNIKYRTKKISRTSLSLNDGYKTHEQTVRRVENLAASDLSFWPPSLSNIPVHIFSIGSAMRYLVFLTMCQNTDKTEHVLSLHMMNQQMAFSEASTMTHPNEDRGLRWQVQDFVLPIEVSNVAPLVIDIDRISYLFIFYFYKGALHFSRSRYRGSGSFSDLVDKTPCFGAITVEERASAQAAAPSMRSRWSILPSLSSQPQEKDPKLSTEPVSREPQAELLPLAVEGCQPYVTITNGFIWVFYEGADGNGTYVRHKLINNVSSLSEDWEAASWATPLFTTGLSRAKDSSVTRHFIPVVVPGDFMVMK